MKFELGVVNEKEIRPIRQLSDIEYEEYKKAAKCLFDFLNDQQLYHFVRLNYDEYINLLKRYLQDYTKNPRTLNMPEMYFNVNRHIFNYLSSIRMLLDHNEYKLKRRCGTDSNRIKRFKDACSKAYDTCFSYRFLYKLRDYAQHCAMPVGNLTIEAKEVPAPSTTIIRSLSVQFDRDKLLSRFDWKSRLRKEIQELPPHFDITQHIVETMNCLEMISLTLIEDDFPQLLKSAEYIKQLIAPTKDMAGVPFIIRIEKIDAQGKNLKVEIAHIPLGLVEMVMNTKNRLSFSK